ncbi:unnamed protein product [Protopolystoma xenopodis]|uniref:Uncharacterized protein n=1 Tax=Protopolystoma xenopodis TaxID=117903 RepID=A0A448XBC6_9PLAT|nr:unnamed protein product [Protopolystoma xenopodis]
MNRRLEEGRISENSEKTRQQEDQQKEDDWNKLAFRQTAAHNDSGLMNEELEECSSHTHCPAPSCGGEDTPNSAGFSDADPTTLLVWAKQERDNMLHRRDAVEAELRCAQTEMSRLREQIEISVQATGQPRPIFPSPIRTDPTVLNTSSPFLANWQVYMLSPHSPLTPLFNLLCLCGLLVESSNIQLFKSQEAFPVRRFNSYLASFSDQPSLALSTHIPLLICVTSPNAASSYIASASWQSQLDFCL